MRLSEGPLKHRVANRLSTVRVASTMHTGGSLCPVHLDPTFGLNSSFQTYQQDLLDLHKAQAVRCNTKPFCPAASSVKSF